MDLQLTHLKFLGTIFLAALWTCSVPQSGEANGDDGQRGSGTLMLSRSADFSTMDRVFTPDDILHIKVTAPDISPFNLEDNQFRLKPAQGGDADVKDVEGQLVPQLDGTFTAQVALAQLSSSPTRWELRVELKDDRDHEFEARVQLTLNGDGKEDFDQVKLKATLKASREVPVVSSAGIGHFEAEILDETTIRYKLQWSHLEGMEVTQAHVHLGQRGVNGGVMAFLCSSEFGAPPANPSPDSPLCAVPSQGEVIGMITPSSIIGPAAQGIEPGEFAEVLRAIRRGNSYVNVHTDRFPSGEIRGQITAHRDGRHPRRDARSGRR